LKKAEAILLDERRRHDYIHQPDFQKNLSAIQAALIRDTVDKNGMARVEDTDSFPPNTYEYLSFPFDVFITSVSGQPEIVWLRAISD
jgi:hypothetical protein